MAGPSDLTDSLAMNEWMNEWPMHSWNDGNVWTENDEAYDDDRVMESKYLYMERCLINNNKISNCAPCYISNLLWAF